MGRSEGACVHSVRSLRKTHGDKVLEQQRQQVWPPLRGKAGTVLFFQRETCCRRLSPRPPPPIPVKPKKGSTGCNPTAARPPAAPAPVTGHRHWRYWRGVVPLSGGFPAADAGAPFANSMFYRESPCGRSVNGESVCRGAQRRRRMQPAKCRAFSSARHTFYSRMIFWRRLETSKQADAHSAPRSWRRSSGLGAWEH